jgi:flavodoxin
MKTLVTYFSQTGKTRLVAEAIYGAVSGDKEIKEFDQVGSLDGYDLAFIGFPIPMERPKEMTTPILEFFREVFV